MDITISFSEAATSYGGVESQLHGANRTDTVMVCPEPLLTAENPEFKWGKCPDLSAVARQTPPFTWSELLAASLLK